jgi:hypothetical protein
MCPTWCWLGDSEVVDALQTCLDTHACELVSGGSSTPLDELKRAATIVFEANHEVLAPHAGLELASPWRHDIVRAERYAKEALCARMTVREMKRLQISASHDLALTVCDGKRRYEVGFPNQDGTVARIRMDRSHGDGCGIVHPDSRINPYKIYCDKCSAVASNRRRKADAQLRAHASGRHEVGERGARLWVGTCKCCGSEFSNSRPDAGRCDECRKHRRRAPRQPQITRPGRGQLLTDR